MSEADDYLESAEKIRSGEYFREAQGVYDLLFHDTMAERYLFMLITGMAGLILCITLIAMQGLYPLRNSVPFIVSTQNIVNDLPRIRTLIAQPGENPSIALADFLISNYIMFREEYDINTFDRNISGVQTQSSQEVFTEFEHLIDPHNPESPTALYERHSKRVVSIISKRRVSADGNQIEVIYDAMVANKSDVKKSRWEANITFNYSGIALDESTGKVKPLGFMVTSYRTKRLQDIK